MNKFRNYFFMATGFAVLTGIVSGITAAPAIAQAVKAALTKNVDERGRVPYTATSQCQSTGGCVANGTPVPAGKRLVIEHVSARLFDPSPAQSLELDLFNGTAYVANTHFVLASQFNGFYTYTVNEPVLMYVEAGKTPYGAVIDGPGNLTTLDVTLTGYLVDLSI